MLWIRHRFLKILNAKKMKNKNDEIMFVNPIYECISSKNIVKKKLSLLSQIRMISKWLIYNNSDYYLSLAVNNV